ncbi:HupE/UreJ family protein [Antribacter gilvus]|uniref:HupE/UreJ family protein n=1 Tax=Antribacter gilvus TaxID=2304675 RepID=UPI000F796F07|nr:HupE/UreJ family protein [Antribacter gilvus]
MPAPRPLPRPALRARLRALLTTALVTLAAVAGTAAVGQPAAAHDVTSTAFAEVRAGSGADVDVTLDLEYDLLMKSAWLTAEAYEATGPAEQQRQLETNADAVAGYVTARFGVRYRDAPCEPDVGEASLVERGEVVYAHLPVAFACDGEPEGSHAVWSALFPDAESFVHSTRTIVEFSLDGEHGSAALTADHPEVVTGENRLLKQLGEFFLLGAEHLYLGPDHLLFLLALVVGARTLREVVWTATAFTAAHSVTFLLAALGVVQVPGAVVEPLIALSIAVVAGASLWPELRRWGRRYAEPVGRTATAAPDGGPAAPRTRLAVVFAFGLLHGLGFAGALGIDERWSWDLLWSLLAFNVGIEAVQLGIVAVVFPLVALLRRRAPRAARWTLGLATAAIVATGLFWTAERLLA